ncbi:enterochelin esterase [Actinoplanes sp. NPDC049802]|uniref:enterochelin esterase n=1 Tax=Actinoplanes sp. NPDC049802 TaxID=3154742 RepID=UPI0033ECB1FF
MWPPVIVESPRIEALRAAGPTALDRFWAEIERDGSPLVEKDGDATLITFLWREREPVRDVLALVNKLVDRSDLARSRMRHMPGTDLWHLTYRVRDDWQATYHLAPDDGSGDLRRAAANGVPDPLNPVTFPQERPPHKSVAAAPAATPEPRWWRPDPAGPAGIVDETTAGGRRVWRYRPPGHTADAGPYPLLVLLDGDLWAPLLPVAPILDNLIAAGRIPPVVALLPDGADHATRSTEYACHPGHAEFLATLPGTAGRDLAPTTDPSRTVIAGQSLGGLMAAFTAMTHPNRFGNVLSQSGAFWWKSHTPGDEEAEWLAHHIAVTDRRPIRWHVEVGLDEWVTLRPNRHLRDVLLARGYPVTYAEFAGGHDRLCWRERLGDALTNLFTEESFRYA